jgi:hypothetical protein
MTPQETLPEKFNGLGVQGKKISKTGKSQLEKEKAEMERAVAAYMKKKKAVLAQARMQVTAQDVAMPDAQDMAKATSEEEINEKMKKTGITKPPLQFAHGAT